MGANRAQVIAVIPARYGSTRFPGKPLAKINGRPLLEWVVRGCQSARRVQAVLVATDDTRIFDLAVGLGVEAVMTDVNLPSGSDRVFQAVRDRNFEIVLNVQGDEPLITGDLLDVLVEPLLKDPSLSMATLARSLREGDLESRQTAKIVVNDRGEALYFSRLPIPYSRADAPRIGGVSWKHIGLYGYRLAFLRDFVERGPCPLEEAEGLEQLRALEMGARIRVIPVDHDSWGVDFPEDVERVESLLRQREQK